MPRRLLFALALLALSAGFTAPGSVLAGMDCEQIWLQAPASDCGTEGMAAGACTAACHGGPCIVPTLAQAGSATKAAQPSAQLSARHSERAGAPDTAPPKNFIA